MQIVLFMNNIVRQNKCKIEENRLQCKTIHQKSCVVVEILFTSNYLCRQLVDDL